MGLFDKPEELGRRDTQRLDALEARVQQLEATVALLAQHSPPFAPSLSAPSVPGLSADVLARVQGLKRDGKVIQAIKVYREATGTSLSEAKADVDAM